MAAVQTVYSDLNSEHQGAVLRAIGAVYGDADSTASALEWVLSSGTVRDQDKLRALYSLRRCFGREQSWRLLTENGEWDRLFALYGSGFSAQDLTEMANAFASTSWYDAVFAFYEESGRTTSSNERSVNQSLESIQVRSEWMERNFDDVAEYLLTVEPDHDGDSGTEHALEGILTAVCASVLAVLLLLCCGAATRWLWRRRKDAASKRFGYRMQSEDGDRAMVGEERESQLNAANVTLAMQSIDDAGHHFDDGGL